MKNTIMKVFISHTHKDKALAKEVATALEKAGLNVWSFSEIVPGENWAERIGQELNESDAMVVLLSSNALESQSVRFEIDYALSEKKYRKRLIPVLIGDLEDRIPWILKRLKTINLPEHGRNEEQLKQIAQALKEVA
jgi:hypothetical protein